MARASPRQLVCNPVVAERCYQQFDLGSKARFIGTQVEVALEYEYSRNLGFLVSYSQFRPGRYIKDTGPSKTVHFVGTELELKF